MKQAKCYIDRCEGSSSAEVRHRHQVAAKDRVTRRRRSGGEAALLGNSEVCNKLRLA